MLYAFGITERHRIGTIINLISILNYLSWLMDNDSEIILVEQDSESKINWLKDIKKTEKIKHIFVKKWKFRCWIYYST